MAGPLSVTKRHHHVPWRRGPTLRVAHLACVAVASLAVAAGVGRAGADSNAATSTSTASAAAVDADGSAATGVPDAETQEQLRQRVHAELKERHHGELQRACMATVPADQLEGYALQHDMPTSPIYKTGVIAHLVSLFDIAVCVETGTFRGATTLVLGRLCDETVTIELHPQLAANARDDVFPLHRAGGFAARSVQGDSGAWLDSPAVLLDPRPTFFWLDGHWSGAGTARLPDDIEDGWPENPILRELELVLSRRYGGNDVILVDDVRLFSGGGFPALQQVVELVCRLRPTARMLYEGDDLLRILPPFDPPTCDMWNAAARASPADGGAPGGSEGDQCAAFIGHGLPAKDRKGVMLRRGALVPAA